MLVFLIPVISAFIGWFTNFIMIKILFYPKKPVNVGFYQLQGIFPKRQKEIAEKIGKLVAEELFSFENISAKLSDPAKIKRLLPGIADQMDGFLRKKLPESMPVLSMFIGDSTIHKIKSVFMDEMEVLLPSIIHQYVDNHREELDFEKMVVDKVNGFSSHRLEEVFNSIMKKELRFVRIIGAVIGFILGIVELFIIFLLK